MGTTITTIGLIATAVASPAENTILNVLENAQSKVHMTSSQFLNKDELKKLGFTGSENVKYIESDGKTEIIVRNFRILHLIKSNKTYLVVDEFFYKEIENPIRNRGWFSSIFSGLKLLVDTVWSPFRAFGNAIVGDAAEAKNVFTNGLVHSWDSFEGEMKHQFNSWKSWIPGFELSESLIKIFHGECDNGEFENNINEIKKIMFEGKYDIPMNVDGTKWQKMARGQFMGAQSQTINSLIVDNLASKGIKEAFDKTNRLKEEMKTYITDAANEVLKHDLSENISSFLTTLAEDINKKISYLLDRRFVNARGFQAVIKNTLKIKFSEMVNVVFVDTFKVAFNHDKDAYLTGLGRALADFIKEEINVKIKKYISKKLSGDFTKFVSEAIVKSSLEEEINILGKTLTKESIEASTEAAIGPIGWAAMAVDGLSLLSELSVYNEIYISKNEKELNGVKGRYVKVKVYTNDMLIGQVEKLKTHDNIFFLSIEELSRVWKMHIDTDIERYLQNVNNGY